MELRWIEGAHGTLCVRIWPHRGPTLVCLHGFTLHGQMFAELASNEGLAHRVVAPDLPGHGKTAIAPVDLRTTLASLGEWLGQSDGPHPVLGYSQGGRIALHLAIDRPDLVSRLVLVSTGTGLAEPLRTERRIADDDLAHRIEEIGVSSFLDAWLTDPLTTTRRLPAATRAADRTMREENTATGLAAALRGLGQGAVGPVDLDTLTVPTLWVAGSRDQRYAASASDAAARSHGRAVILDGVGHNVVAESPHELAQTIAEFLKG